MDDRFDSVLKFEKVKGFSRLTLMIGIVGNGFVGNAVYQNVRDKAPTKVYDVDPNRSFSTLEEVLDQQYISSAFLLP